jgi:hypothetical protein
MLSITSTALMAQEQATVFVYQPATVLIANPGYGWYVGGDLGGGSSKCNNCTIDFTTTSPMQSTTTNHGFMAGLFAGYQFNPYLAFELGFGSLPATKIVETGYTWWSSQVAYKITDIRYAYTNHAYLAIKGMLPFNSQFSLFAKLGLDAEQVSYRDWYTGSDVDTNATGSIISLGASYYFSPHWSGLLSLNRVHTTKQSTTFESNYLALGFSYLIF